MGMGLLDSFVRFPFVLITHQVESVGESRVPQLM